MGHSSPTRRKSTVTAVIDSEKQISREAEASMKLDSKKKRVCVTIGSPESQKIVGDVL
jgi:ABC-type uncharacterized transport system substrate-binding protein